MSRFSFFLFFFIIFNSSLIAQEKVEKVRIEKDKFSLYQGARPDTQNWYVYIESNQVVYMANLNLPNSEVNNWFETFKNSQNIFKGLIQNGSSLKTIRLEKENEPESSLLFYLDFKDKNTLILTAFSDGESFQFVKINTD